MPPQAPPPVAPPAQLTTRPAPGPAPSHQIITSSLVAGDSYSEDGETAGWGTASVGIIIGLMGFGCIIVVCYICIRRYQKRHRRALEAEQAASRADKAGSSGKEHISLPVQGSATVMAIAADDPTVDAFIPGNSPPREPPRPESDLGEGGGVKRPPERSHFSMDSDDEEQQGSRTRTILSRLSRKSKVGRSSAAVPSLSSMPTRPPLYEQATAGDSRPGPKPIQRGSSPVPGRHAPSAAPSSDSQLHDGGEVDLDDFASMRQGDSND